MYAGFWRRFGGLFLDGLVLGVLATFVTTILGSQGAISAALGVLFSTAYQVYFFTRTGQTLGAKVMGIKVVDTDGNPLSVDLALIRVVGSYVSSALLGLGYLLMLWDSHRQTLHDKMAGSLVIKVPTPASSSRPEHSSAD
jgi:uncharacterized RDD family membrane protein YckC